MFGLQVRTMDALDIRSAVGLQRLCFPPPFPRELLWNAEHLERHIALFPEGQFVVVACNDPILGNPKKQTVLGSASSLILGEAIWQAHGSWEETCGGFFFENHDPAGTTLFGADISVHPGYRGRGIGRMLYQARFDLVRRLGLARFATACRIPGYLAWSQGRTSAKPQTYCAEVAKGALTDHTLTPLLSYGLRLLAVSENHMEDEESGGAAAILEWVP